MPLSRQQNFPQLDFKANRGKNFPPSSPTLTGKAISPDQEQNLLVPCRGPSNVILFCSRTESYLLPQTPQHLPLTLNRKTSSRIILTRHLGLHPSLTFLPTAISFLSLLFHWMLLWESPVTFLPQSL